MPAPSPSDLLNFSQLAYTTGGASPPSSVTLSGTTWTLIKFTSQTSNGMQAVAYQNNAGVVVIAFEGTNPNNAVTHQSMLNSQLAADSSIAAGTIPTANIEAVAFANAVAALPSVGSNPIYVTGHSLGGEEAEYVAAKDSANAYTISGGATFGAPGVPNQSAVTVSNFTAYVDAGDFIGNFIPSNGVRIGTLQPLGNSNHAALEANWNAAGLAPLAIGLAIYDHGLDNYAKDLGVTLSSPNAWAGSPDFNVFPVGGVTVTGSTSSTGLTAFSLSNGHTVDVVTQNNLSINIPSSGDISVIAPSGPIFSAEVIHAGGGSVSFTDALGNAFASYTSSQVAGGKVTITDNGIVVSNGADQILNSTQEVSIGSNRGVLDKVWNTSNPGITEVNVLGQNATVGLVLQENGTGLTQSNGSTYFYQNGTETLVNIPQMAVSQVARYFVTDDNEIIATLKSTNGTPNGSLIYSGAAQGYTGGTTTAIAGPNGLPFAVLAVSSNGDIMVGITSTSTATTWWIRDDGVYTTLTPPTITPPGGGALSPFYITDVNNNGQILGYFIKGGSDPATGIISAVYNYNTAALTVLPNHPNGALGTTFSAINDSGDVVGAYQDANLASRAIILKNGAFTEISIPGITPHFTPSLASKDALYAIDITNNGTVVVQHNYNPTIFGTESAEDFVVSSSASSVTSTLHIAPSSTVDLSSQTQLAGTTLNLVGGSNTVTLAANMNVTAADTAGNDNITAGSTNTVNIGSGSSMDNGDFVHISGGTVSLAANAWADIYGGSNTIALGQNSLAGIQGGNNNAITAHNGTTIYLNSGTGDVVTTPDGNVTIFAESGVSFSVVGGGNGGIAADGDTINISGNGQYGDSNYFTLSNGTVHVANDARADIYGGGNTITVGQSSLLGIQNGSNNTIAVGEMSAVYVNSGTGDVLTGNNFETYADTGVSVSVVGSRNSVYGADGDTVSLSGGNGQFGNGSYVHMNYGTINLSANTHTDVFGGNNTIVAGASTLIGIQDGNSNKLTAGANSVIWVNNGSGDLLTLTGNGGEVNLETGVSNVSITASNATINAADGDMFNVTGSNDVINASNAMIYLNANTTGITINGTHNTVHIRPGDTYTLSPNSQSTVITDIVVNAQNNTTIANFDGDKTLVDFTGLPFNSSITANIVQNSGGYAGQMFVYDHGVLAAKVNLSAVQHLHAITVRPDGSGGTLVVDPPLDYLGTSGVTASDPTHHAFTDAWHALTGGTGNNAPTSHGLRDHFNFVDLTPTATVPEGRHSVLQDFVHGGDALVRDGPFQHIDPATALVEAAHQVLDKVAGTHSFDGVKFDFSNLPSLPPLPERFHDVLQHVVDAAAHTMDNGHTHLSEGLLSPHMPNPHHFAEQHHASLHAEGWHL